MKAIGYARISKDEEGSISLDYQTSEIRKYAITNELDLIDIEIDNGISGKSISTRPAVQRVLQLVDAKAIDAVVVFKSDRMSRDGLESLQIEKLFLKRQVQYHSVAEGCITSDSVDDEFMSYIRAGLNQRERKLISYRTKKALARKKEKGERISGKPPFGYYFTPDGMVVPDNHEQLIIRTVRKISEDGMSIRCIQRKLTKDGFYSRNGNKLSVATIHGILKRQEREIY